VADGVVRLAGAPPRIEERRLSKLSICRRIETASSKALTDISIGIPTKYQLRLAETS
jgi:hypothetical protein